MIVRTPRSFGRGSPVHAYWLSCCKGFNVEADGRVLGRVEEILCADPVSPDALVVRTGGLRRRERLVPVREVVAVVPATRALLMADVEAAPHTRASVGHAAVVLAGHAWTGARLALRLTGRFVAWAAPRLGRLAFRAAAAAVRAVRAKAPVAARALRALSGELRRWRMGSAWWPGRARP
jgi:hypothetical protein